MAHDRPGTDNPGTDKPREDRLQIESNADRENPGRSLNFDLDHNAKSGPLPGYASVQNGHFRRPVPEEYGSVVLGHAACWH